MKLPVPIDTAVLLAAGRGKRLAPWTDRTPKPLLPHRGQATLDRLLDSLERAGISRVVLVTHHLADQIKAYTVRRRAVSSQELICIRQDNLFGTAHAIECVMRARPEFLVTPFVLSATDYLLPLPFYRELLRFHVGHDAELSVSLKPIMGSVEARSSVRFARSEPGARESLLTLSTERRDREVIGSLDIDEIVEKPVAGSAPSGIAANLCFVLPPELLEHVPAVEMSVRGEREIQDAINAWLAAGGRARGLLGAAPLEWQPPVAAKQA